MCVDARHTLRLRNLRCIKQRKLLYEALATRQDHPRLEALRGRARIELDLSLATVCNTLEAFVRLALSNGSKSIKYNEL